jgi:hypothetical protein
MLFFSSRRGMASILLLFYLAKIEEDQWIQVRPANMEAADEAGNNCPEFMADLVEGAA